MYSSGRGDRKFEGQLKQTGSLEQHATCICQLHGVISTENHQVTRYFTRPPVSPASPRPRVQHHVTSSHVSNHVTSRHGSRSRHVTGPVARHAVPVRSLPATCGGLNQSIPAPVAPRLARWGHSDLRAGGYNLPYLPDLSTSSLIPGSSSSSDMADRHSPTRPTPPDATDSPRHSRRDRRDAPPACRSRRGARPSSTVHTPAWSHGGSLGVEEEVGGGESLPRTAMPAGITVRHSRGHCQAASGDRIR